MTLLRGRGSGALRALGADLETRAALLGLEGLAWPVLSRLYGHLSDLPLPRPLLGVLLRAFVRHFGVDMSESAEPLEAFDTLDAFFTRELKPGARPVSDAPGALVSAADGLLCDAGSLERGRLIQAKGRSYSPGELLDDPAAAERLRRGFTYTVYLSPPDYHRVHSPVEGRVAGYRYVPGRLYPVHAFSRTHIDRVFCRNERLVTHMETEQGRCTVVLVGATFVGRISAAFAPIVTNRGPASTGAHGLEPPVDLARGAELGAFHMGSTVVVLHERPHRLAEGLAEGSAVRMGQVVARLAKPRGRR